MAGREYNGLSQAIHTVFTAGALGTLTDSELVERFTAEYGEASELAFAALVERHRAMVLLTCRAVLRDAHDSYDAFQATFLVLARKAQYLRIHHSVGPWLFRVAHRTASIARKARGRRQRHERAAAIGAARCSSDRNVDDLAEVLHGEIARLPERYRAAIVLCLVEEMTHEHAARRLGWPLGTLESRLARGREMLRGRLERRGLAPEVGAAGTLSSLAGSGQSSSVPRSLAESTVRASLRVGIEQSAMASGYSAKVASLAEGALRMMFTAKLKTGLVVLVVVNSLALLAALPVPLIRATAKPAFGDMSGSVAEPKTPHEPKTTDSTVASDQSSTVLLADEPEEANSVKRHSAALLRGLLPKPWETAVRVRALHAKSIGFGSGTVIYSSSDESLILTCAHIFKLDGSRQTLPSEYPQPIKVDLFDGKLRGTSPAKVHFLETVDGECIDFDFDRDVALIRIRPGRRLFYSRIVPQNWLPHAGMRMVTIGCSEGADATVWHTSIVNPSPPPLAGNEPYEAIECETAPKQGRAGGGLFTLDGYLAGVCNFADPANNRGLYAVPSAIYQLLDWGKLAYLYRDEAQQAAGAASGDKASQMTDEPVSSAGSGNRANAPPLADRGLEYEGIDRRLNSLVKSGKSDATAAPVRPDDVVGARESRRSRTIKVVPESDRLRDLERRIDGIEQKLDHLQKTLQEANRRQSRSGSSDAP
jgi:RNA polymerase sigma factor (sigma-70 family)